MVVCLKYFDDTDGVESIFRSCRRCGINMEISPESGRFLCDDCVEYEAQFRPGIYDWLFEGAH